MALPTRSLNHMDVGPCILRCVETIAQQRASQVHTCQFARSGRVSAQNFAIA